LHSQRFDVDHSKGQANLDWLAAISHGAPPDTSSELSSDGAKPSCARFDIDYGHGAH
jgi:hypothetical protein